MPAETAEIAEKPLRMPRSTWFIVSTEACERFSFYGMVSILTLYLQYQLGMGDDGAKERVHFFNAAVYYLPLLGGFLADKFLGRYRTILFLSLFYCLGHGILALFEGKEIGIYVGLGLIAIGAGGIKPCVSAFVADQFEGIDERGLSKIYGIFYWAVNLGAVFAFLIIPKVAPQWDENGKKISENWGYSWAFGIPGIFMGIAALVFWMGSSMYLKRPPEAKIQVQKSPEEMSADRNTLLRIIVVLSPIVIFWALFYQLNTSWVQQGEKMAKTSVLGYVVDGQSMQTASGILILILVPFMVIVCYPFMCRIGLPTSMISKITIGMFVTSLGFAISGLLQNRLDGGTKLSVLWQLLPYIPLEIGEVMVSVTGLEFAYANAPARMKGLVMGVWFGITGTGNLCVALLTAFIGTSKVASNGSIIVPDDGKRFHLTAADQFFYYAASMLCGAIVFAIISHLLMGKNSQEDAVTQAE